MNNVQTVTQKQCTESKNWLGAPSAQPGQPALGRVVVVPPGRVAGPGGRVASLLRALHGSVMALHGRVMALCRDTAQQPHAPLGHDTLGVLRHKSLSSSSRLSHDTKFV